MVDSGATMLFLDRKYTNHQKIRLVPLEHPISLYNIDGTLNEAGSITHKARLNLKVGSEVHQHDFYVMQIGPEKVILGLPWLCMRNPFIDWQKGKLRLNSNSEDAAPEECEIEVTHIAANMQEHRQLLVEKVLKTTDEEVYCLAGFMLSQKITEQQIQSKPKQTFDKWSLSTTTTLQKSSLRKNPRGSLNINHGITPLNLNQMQSGTGKSRCILCCLKSKMS